MKEPEDIQDPENDGNDDNAVQDGLDRGLHGEEAIDQPQQNAHHDENFYQLNQGHDFGLSARAAQLPFALVPAQLRPMCTHPHFRKGGCGAVGTTCHENSELGTWLRPDLGDDALLTTSPS